MRHKDRIRTLATLTLCLLAGGAGGADEQGRFAIKGIGNTGCDAFLVELDKRTPNVYMYGGWAYGFITGENRYAGETFDLAGWEDLETLTTYLAGYCGQHPDHSFAQATFALVDALRADRLRSATAPVSVGSTERPLHVYKETLRRVQQSLKDRGMYQGPVDGSYTAELRLALEGFQQREKLPVTGLPDQPSLHRLFRQP